MKHYKKGIALLSALLLSGAFAFSFGGCNKNQNDSDSDTPPIEETGGVLSFSDHNWTGWESVKEATCTQDGLEKLVCHDENCKEEKTRVVKASHEWNAWTGDFDGNCTQETTLTRSCKNCSETERSVIPATGHNYDEKDAQCSVCDEALPYPTMENGKYTDVFDLQNPNDPNPEPFGSAYNRIEVTSETYYTVPLSAGDCVFLSVSVPSAGQYVLYTVSGANGATIKRHDASAHFIPEDANGNYIGIDAVRLSNGEYASVAQCAQKYWSSSWRGTWSITASENTEVKLIVKRVADSVWAPETVYEEMSPTQLKKMKAPDGPEGLPPTDVPYDAEYFFDEWNGVYRMGTKENPGKVIYVAITFPAQRLLGDKSFAEIQAEGNNLTMQIGKTETGIPLVREYAGFISATYSTETNNSYDLFVNNAGLYPVNEELHEFLVLYTNTNTVSDLPDEYNTSQEVREKHAWLSACYYYGEVVYGTEAHPHEIGLGEHEITTTLFDYVYYNVKYEDANNTTGVYYCTISCEDENSLMIMDDVTYKGPFSVKIEINPTLGKTFSLAGKGGAAVTYTLTVAKADV